MQCPKCGAPKDSGRVVMTQPSDTGETVRRRRCLECGHRWYTMQLPEQVLPSYAIQWPKSIKRSQGDYIVSIKEHVRS